MEPIDRPNPKIAASTIDWGAYTHHKKYLFKTPLTAILAIKKFRYIVNNFDCKTNPIETGQQNNICNRNTYPQEF